MAPVGFIGSGRIGGTVARLAVAAGYQVIMSNSRGPQTLTGLVGELGPLAQAGSGEQAAAGGELVVLTIPLRAYQSVPAAPLAGKLVIDTCNYYPQRDGQIAQLDSGSATSSELIGQHLPGAQVVKAFNNIYYADLAAQGQPAGTPGRRALPIAGDDPEAKKAVADLIEEFGFDVVDAGGLAEGRRFQRGTPANVTRLDAGALRAALAEA